MKLISVDLESATVLLNPFIQKERSRLHNINGLIYSFNLYSASPFHSTEHIFYFYSHRKSAKKYNYKVIEHEKNGMKNTAHADDRKIEFSPLSYYNIYP